MIRGQRFVVQASRSEPRGRRTGGLLGLVAGSGSNWFEGVGLVLTVLAARTEGGEWVVGGSGK